MPAALNVHSPRPIRVPSSHSTPLIHQFPYLAALMEPENDPGRLYSPSLLSTSFFGSHGNNVNSAAGQGAEGYFGSTAAMSPEGSTHHNNNSMNACDFETAFCRDFYCCGITLLDLHDLLQHYEECHVRFEEEDDDEDYDEDFDGDGFGSASHSGESEFFDEEGTCGGNGRLGGGSGAGGGASGGGGGGFWSDSDSAMSRSPSSSSPSLLMDGFSSSGSGHSESSSRSASRNRYGHSQGAATAAAAVGNLSRIRSVFDQLHHPLYTHRFIDTSNPATHALEAFSVSASRPLKRKDVVSLSDLYMEDEDGYHGDDTSAFSSAILRTPNVNTSERIGPLVKRQSLDGNRLGPAVAPASTSTSTTSFATPSTYPGSLFPGNVILGGNGKPIGPLSGSHYHDPFAFGCPNSLNYHSSGAPMMGSVDWMRQRDEVFSILEDMTRVPSNASDENKPYRCSVPGCDKAYKNPNGLKYHNQHGHSSSSLADADNPEARPYVCTFLECGKRYKNLNGLKYHIEHTHPNMIAALRAHQAGLFSNPALLIANGGGGGAYGMNHQAAAMTVAAALSAVEQSPMMAMAANAILTAHATAAAAAAAAATASASVSLAGASGDIAHESNPPGQQQQASEIELSPTTNGPDAVVANESLQVPTATVISPE
ncbi:hypothetical protein B0O80DRAFT_164449 [Mortierella sp. GBAus27b]|nr:hypothetical protein B0O80DRAFT_164449 [Mortierella sp. GBAus27b]